MDEMKSHGLQLQRLTYNSLILACVRGGDMARAFELLTAMKVLNSSLFVNCLEQNTH
jgi:pentatricopeptide repeat protein